MTSSTPPVFAPQLYIKSGVTDISFYEKAFGAVQIMRFDNEDGSLHVAELSINGTIFHLHETTLRAGLFDTEKCNGSTVLIGLFVDDVDAWMQRAIAAGAVEVNPAQDYDYGYRQGDIKDPFGHTWMLENKI
jgi:PhnB protein